MKVGHLPKVSVCIPVYNPGDFLRPAVASVLTQGYTDFELLVVDDCSREPVAELLDAFTDERMTYVRNETNLGLAGNWNKCIDLAQGEYVAIFHQDDVMYTGNLQTKVDLLTAHPTVGMVHSDVKRIDERHRVIGGHWASQPCRDQVQTGQTFFGNMALYRNFVSCPTVMARAACYKELGGFDAGLPYTLDMEMWMRIAGRYDVGYLDEPLVGKRIHTNQETSRFTGQGREIMELRSAMAMAFARYPRGPVSARVRCRARRNLAGWGLNIARWKLRQGRLRPALGYMRAALMALLPP